MKIITLFRVSLILTLMLGMVGCVSDLVAYQKRLPVIHIHCNGQFVERATLLINSSKSFVVLDGIKAGTEYDKKFCTFKKEGSTEIVTIFSHNGDPSPEFTIREE